MDTKEKQVIRLLPDESALATLGMEGPRSMTTVARRGTTTTPGFRS